ncbi:MAG TPA: DUF4239 domain-containing protein [Cytophagaceae bacterium]|jgi:hypothetical protein|nr:DUF4239 domain-containing protein [Cytophagaceae bacterium]
MNLLLFSFATVIVFCTALYFFEKYFQTVKDKFSNESIGIYFNFTGVLYTLILAFVVVAAWTDYDNAMVTVESEAHKLLYIYEDAEELSPENRSAVQKAVLNYTHSVIGEEWNEMDQGVMVKSTENKFHDLIVLKRILKPNGDDYVLNGIDTSLDELKELRRSRLSYNESHVPNLLWTVLAGGYLLCVFFSFLVDFNSLTWKMIMTSIMVFTMSIVMYLTYCLSNPYKGDMEISSADYQKTLELIKKIK